MVKVSVIVPVFNARDYIIPCVESLVNQSLDEIELLFVDDHGTDDSIDAVRNFLDAYSGKKQFRFLETTVNSGPGVARNVGIEAAAGEYVAFVDSDDWIEREFCESLYKAASRRNADIAFCNLRQDNLRDGSSTQLCNPEVSSGDFSVRKHKEFLPRFVSYFTTYLYRREFRSVTPCVSRIRAAAKTAVSWRPASWRRDASPAWRNPCTIMSSGAVPCPPRWIPESTGRNWFLSTLSLPMPAARTFMGRTRMRSISSTSRKPS